MNPSDSPDDEKSLVIAIAASQPLLAMTAARQSMPVIASAARQSMPPLDPRWIATACGLAMTKVCGGLAMTNRGPSLRVSRTGPIPHTDLEPPAVIASKARRSIVEKSGFMDCHTTFAMTAGSWKSQRGNKLFHFKLMRSLTRSVLFSLLAVALTQALPALGADAEADALSLESAPEVALEAARDTKLFIEGAIGNASQRYLPESRDIGRVSLDFSHSARLAPGLRAVMSDRLDHIYPRDAGADATVNSLREAYLSWQPDDGNTVVELGRINLRHGPGYGYNPTDFFRDGSLRTLTTANPFALRENRLGTVMLRGQRLWSDGSLSLAYSPKLADRPSPDGWSLDLGSTNNRDRALIALSTQFSQRVSSQVLAYKEDGMSPMLGASLTALLSDAAVAHLEWSRGSEPDLLSRALALPGAAAARNRFTGGITYTTLGKLSVTAEYQYNGFALNQPDWAALGAAPATQMAYLLEAQRRQELAPRQAYLLYLTQKSLMLKNLDLTAFLRVNAGDHSQLAWLELRHHWPSFDVALQLQQHIGDPTSEYGILPDRRVVQMLGTYYF